MLHVPQGGRRVVVAVAGPLSRELADELRRWPDVGTLYVPPHTATPKDSRIRVAPSLPIGEVDLVVLSPEQNPHPFLPALRPGGIIQASTYAPHLWGPLRKRLQADVGSSMPWREHLPKPLYGVLSRLGPSAPKRVREVPKTATRINKQFLPCFFTFGRDELAWLHQKGEAQRVAR